MTRRRDVVELVVFLLLLVPGIVLAQVSTTSDETFVLASVGTILHDIALGALVLFFVWSGGRPISSVGWTTRHLAREIGLGVILYPAMLVALAIISLVVIACARSRTASFRRSRSRPSCSRSATRTRDSPAC